MKPTAKCRLVMTAEEMRNDHDAWLKFRGKGIGGSDAGAISGLNPWKSPWQLWLEKTGQAAPEDISGKAAVKAGIKLEPVVADMFSEETGKKLRRCGMLQSIKDPWMLANVDRLLTGEDVGLEIKTTNAFSASEWDGDGVPPSYYCQCLHYMMCTGYKGWWIAVLIGGQDFRYKFIDGTEPGVQADMKELFQMEEEFWNVNVKQMVMPDVDGSKATAEALRQKYGGGNLDPVELPAEAADTIRKLEDAKAREKEVKEEITLYENQLKAQMGDNELAFSGDRWVSWKTQNGRTTFDSKRFKADHPDLFPQYAKIGKPIRVFKISKKKDKGKEADKA